MHGAIFVDECTHAHTRTLLQRGNFAYDVKLPYITHIFPSILMLLSFCASIFTAASLLMSVIHFVSMNVSM